MRTPKKFWIVTTLVLAAGASGALWLGRKPAAGPSYRLARIERGDINQRTKATGTLNALVQISVGTQVSGVVTALYADFNSRVRKGQVIALIDPTISETQLTDAQAGLQRAQAAYDNAKSDLDRNQHLATLQLISASELESRTTAFKTAGGNLESARAALVRARINLSYCTITAPVDGVVVSRVVDVGQTVAASFSTPSLFSIAQDLSRMKLQASIDEADIGQVEVGQPVRFTVDSYPDESFQGQVSEVQLNPTINNNVVTYSVVMEVANVARKHSSVRPVATGTGTARYIIAGSPVYRGDYALLPGMTANVDILTSRRAAVLRVPNMALRFDPVLGATGGGGGQGGAERREDHVWVMEMGGPRQVPVSVGISDGQHTEISGEGIREGMQVLVGTESTKKVQETNNSLLGNKGPGGPPPPH